MLPTRTLSPFQIAARGLEAQRVALAASTENIANATTTRTADGAPYRVKRALHEGAPGGARFAGSLAEAQTALRTTDPRHLAGARLRPARTEALGPTTEVVELDRTRVEFDPEHPDADAAGYVTYPDVNVADEMARMISANRIYEANLTSVQATKEIIKRSLEL